MKRLAAFAAAWAAIVVTICSGCANRAMNAPAPYHVEIRRTSDGVPHVLSNDWGSLGYGDGYVQAQDNLCTLANAFLTFRGERSANFGANGKPDAVATFGEPRNLDADYFFKLIADDDAIARYRAAQPEFLQELINGFASGYNRYVNDENAGLFPGANAACRDKPWVTRITADDVYRRLIAATLAGGATRFVTPIATAQPPASGPESASIALEPHTEDASAEIELRAAQLDLGGRPGFGSNAFAFGARTTRDGASLLLGNPHWFWHGPDRFYQMQLTIPGVINVAGVSLLGVPVVMIGFNDNIAWTHTVSSARRFGIFQLSLVAGDPTHYLYDGHPEAMTPIRITVQTRRTDGTLTPVTRTLYRSRFGPLINLSSMSPALGWDTQHAFALRDVNTTNLHVFENFLDWGTARSLDDFIAVQQRLAAMPWVNTFAIGRNDPRVWFADIGAIPNTDDTRVEACTTSVGRAFDARVPGVPFLDGSKSACDWSSGETNLAESKMPSLLRDDYVGNFNGSYWLTNPTAPLSGMPAVVGATGTQQTLRTRFGHQLAASLLKESGGVSRDALELRVLDSRSMSEQLFRQPLLDTVCSSVEIFSQATPLSSHESGDLREACSVLRAWDGSASVDARGANLWSEFWRRATSDIPPAQFYRVPFDAKRPLTTPSGLNVDYPATYAALREALVDAAQNLKRFGFKLNSTRGELLYTQRNNERVPLFGGCDSEGYFAVVCPHHTLDAGGYSMDRNGEGDSYVQVVSFSEDGVEADTLLAHSQSDDPASPNSADATRQFSRQRWMRFPFTDSAISLDPTLKTITLDSEP